MKDFKFNIPTIIRKLLDDSFNPFTKMDKREDLASYCGYANDFRINMLIKQNDLQFPTARKVLSFFEYNLYAVKNEEYELTSVISAIDLIKKILKKEDIKNIKYAEILGITKVALYKYFRQPNIKVGTLIKMFNALDYEIVAKNVKQDKNDYILGFDDSYDEEYFLNYENFPSNCTTNATGHYEFVEKFIKENILFDIRSKINHSVLYAKYKEYWFNTNALHPTIQIRKKRKYNSCGCLSNKEFKNYCLTKFTIDDNGYYLGVGWNYGSNKI